MTQVEFQKISSGLPNLPGIYKYYDGGSYLLYVGKAKNIRKRVSSYFNKTLGSYKTHELVKRISRIEFTIVNSEQDAFLLENSLIKQFQPLFNINQVKNILKGNLGSVIHHFKKEMKHHSEALEFERAEQTRKKISYLENYQSRSIVVNTSSQT